LFISWSCQGNSLQNDLEHIKSIKHKTQIVSPYFINMRDHIDCQGIVTPLKSVKLKFEVDGLLKNIYFNDGDEVKEGSLIAELDTERFKLRMEAIEKQKAINEEKLRALQNNQVRYQSLLLKKLISKETYNDAVLSTKKAETQVDLDRIALKEARSNLNYAYLYAPFSGRLGLSENKFYNFISAKDLNGIFYLNQIDPIAILFDFPAEQIDNFKQSISQNKISMLISDYNRVLNIEDLEHIALDNEINPTKRTIRIKVTLSNKSQFLWPNQNLKLKINFNRDEYALALPHQAIHYNEEGNTYVYILNKDKKVQRQWITIKKEDAHALVFSGLSEKSKVIIQDGSSLVNQSSVTIVHKN
jgi:multidrug efflux system membrane fusion protein